MCVIERVKVFAIFTNYRVISINTIFRSEFFFYLLGAGLKQSTLTRVVERRDGTKERVGGVCVCVGGGGGIENRDEG